MHLFINTTRETKGEWEKREKLIGGTLSSPTR
jgi:hypothetical protein